MKIRGAIFDMDGAHELLSYLKEQGITLCLASATAMAEIKGAP